MGRPSSKLIGVESKIVSSRPSKTTTLNWVSSRLSRRRFDTRMTLQITHSLENF